MPAKAQERVRERKGGGEGMEAAGGMAATRQQGSSRAQGNKKAATRQQHSRRAQDSVGSWEANHGGSNALRLGEGGKPQLGAGKKNRGAVVIILQPG